MLLKSITPKLAETYLNLNKCNRSLRAGVVERYARDMKEGRWTQCTVPISFYDDGEIADGQHRLYAIIESGTTQKFFILRNLKRGDGLNIDVGAVRSLVDNARIAKLDDHLTNDLIAAALFYEFGNRQFKALSNAEKLAIVQRSREHVHFGNDAIKSGPNRRGFKNAPTAAALARAHANGEHEERLKQFAHVLTSGFAESKADNAAIALRNHVISSNYKAPMNDPRQHFMRVMNCIRAFCANRELNVIRTISEEAYPLPKAKPAKLRKVAG